MSFRSVFVLFCHELKVLLPYKFLKHTYCGRKGTSIAFPSTEGGICFDGAAD